MQAGAGEKANGGVGEQRQWAEGEARENRPLWTPPATAASGLSFDCLYSRECKPARPLNVARKHAMSRSSRSVKLNVRFWQITNGKTTTQMIPTQIDRGNAAVVDAGLVVFITLPAVLLVGCLDNGIAIFPRGPAEVPPQRSHRSPQTTCPAR